MFLHIGGDKTIYMPDIVGIFDISAAENPATCEFLRMANDEDLCAGKKARPNLLLLPMNMFTFRPLPPIRCVNAGCWESKALVMIFRNILIVMGE